MARIRQGDIRVGKLHASLQMKYKQIGDGSRKIIRARRNTSRDSGYQREFSVQKEDKVSESQTVSQSIKHARWLKHPYIIPLFTLQKLKR